MVVIVLNKGVYKRINKFLLVIQNSYIWDVNFNQNQTT